MDPSPTSNNSTQKTVTERRGHQRYGLISRPYWTCTAIGAGLLAYFSIKTLPKDQVAYHVLYTVLPPFLWSLFFGMIALLAASIAVMPTKWGPKPWTPIYVSIALAGLIFASIVKIGGFIIIAFFSDKPEVFAQGWFFAASWILILAAAISRVHEYLIR